jgi:hypothetical protein
LANPRFCPIDKILDKFEHFKFSENLRRIRVETGQKHRSNPNDSFNPVWYGFHQGGTKAAGDDG